MSVEGTTNVASPGASAAASAPAAPSVASEASESATGQLQETPQELQETPAQTKEEIDFARKFATLTRREKQIVLKENALKEMQAKIQAYEDAKENAKLNPIKLLDSLGWSFQDLANFTLNGETLSTDQKLKFLEDRVETESKSKKEAEEQAKEQARAQAEAEQAKAEAETIQTYKNSLKEFVDSNEDRFELVKVNELYDEVYDVVDEYFQNTGTLLTFEQAAQAVETHYETIVRDRVLKTKKFGPKTEETKPHEIQAAPGYPGRAAAPTLTNAGLSTLTPATEKREFLSDDESKRRAAKFLQEALNRQNSQ